MVHCLNTHMLPSYSPDEFFDDQNNGFCGFVKYRCPEYHSNMSISNYQKLLVISPPHFSGLTHVHKVKGNKIAEL